jgi:hypothetical protein
MKTYEELIEENKTQDKMIKRLRDQLTIALEEIQKLKTTNNEKL